MTCRQVGCREVDVSRFLPSDTRISACCRPQVALLDDMFTVGCSCELTSFLFFCLLHLVATDLVLHNIELADFGLRQVLDGVWVAPWHNKLVTPGHDNSPVVDLDLGFSVQDQKDLPRQGRESAHTRKALSEQLWCVLRIERTDNMSDFLQERIPLPSCCPFFVLVTIQGFLIQENLARDQSRNYLRHPAVSCYPASVDSVPPLQQIK